MPGAQYFNVRDLQLHDLCERISGRGSGGRDCGDHLLYNNLCWEGDSEIITLRQVYVEF